MQSEDKKKNGMTDNRRFQKRKSTDKQTKRGRRNQSKSPVKHAKAVSKSKEHKSENNEENGFPGDSHIKVVIRGKEAYNVMKLSDKEFDDDISLGTNLSSEGSDL